MNKKLKVCHVTSMHKWNDGRIFERACTGLVKNGVDVSLVCTYHQDEDVVDGVKIYGIRERKGIAQKCLSSFDAYRLVRKLNTDIIHFHDPILIPFMFLLVMKGRKVIFDIHENYLVRIEKSKLPNFSKKFTMLIWRSIEKKFIKYSGGASVTTESMKELYIDTKVPILVISNFISLDYYQKLNLSSKKDPYPSVCISGTHNDARNSRQAIKAFAEVVKVIPTAKLKFYGKYYPPSYRETLTELIENLHLDNHVELNGMLSREENLYRISKSHIGCVLYEDNLNNKVTIPNRIFEYMYAGVAIIGERFKEVETIINESECGSLVNSSDHIELSKMIIDLLSDQERLKFFGINGRNAIETKYNHENTLVDKLNYYQSILKMD